MKKIQAGSALLVALMILMVVTVVGMSLASANRVDLLMVGAQQSRAQTAEFTQAAIEKELAIGPPSTVTPRVQDYSDASLAVNAQVTSTYAAVTEPPEGGFSMGKGFSAYHYRVQAYAEGPRNTEVAIEQGYYVLGPAK